MKKRFAFLMAFVGLAIAGLGFQNVKLSALTNGGAFVNGTDQIVVVRNGNADRLVTQAAGVINVQDKGIKPSNSAATNSTAIASLVTANTPGAAFYFPKGSYSFNATMDFSAMAWVRLIGDGWEYGSLTGGTLLTGSVNAGLVSYQTVGNGSAWIENLQVVNTHATGKAIHLAHVQTSRIQNCLVKANIGVYAVDNVFDLTISSVQFNGDWPTWNSGVGLMLHSAGACSIQNGDFTSWNVGAQICGSSISFTSCRFEENVIGVKTGYDENNGTQNMYGVFMDSSCASEANGTFLYLGPTYFATIYAGAFGASTQPPTGTCAYGIRSVSLLGDSSFHNFKAGSTFTTACISLEAIDGFYNNVTFQNVSTANDSGSTWVVTNSRHGIRFIDTDFPGVGTGTPIIQANANVTAQSAAGTITSYATKAVDGDFEVSAQVIVTAAASISTTIEVDYTDVNSGAQTMVLPIYKQAGTPVASATIVATGTYETPVMHIRAKASTTITIKTTTGTFTTVTWQGSAVIKQTSGIIQL